ncbi:nitrate reductase molybdenum cofactor assembly chaperone [Streptomyces albus]|uniref:nitrate reductase molybdenum cofactor assembly chaperone n=1 Tax=Streptomyces sp. NRRL F-5639 TaxID=1463867 RepID=UPI0004C62227|nr:nitrate reductase molybdenum cofactor assembly chaperone [Streptomyces sp. NRRL F-5639]
MTAPLVHQAASLLLSYPDDGWPARLRTVTTTLEEVPAASCASRAGLLRFCAEAADASGLEPAARYVATFDRSRRRTLHLTYYTHGDTRARGAALAALKALMRQHGWEVSQGELPDFLPGVLEFAARCPEPGGRLLADHRAALTLLTEALARYGSPYRHVLGAVLSTLPAPPRAERAAVRALARSGPPTETVGLRAAAPPAPGTPAPVPFPRTEGTLFSRTEGPRR